MTKIKFCGMTRECDMAAANEINPEYVGFVFAKSSRRYVSADTAAKLKKLLNPNILAVGVFVDENVENVADLLNRDIIDIAQLHGSENEEYIARLRTLTKKPIIKAFRVKSEDEAEKAEKCSADFVLLDSGAGTGKAFDWSLIKNVKRPYLLAGGLGLGNISEAVKMLSPYAVDVSSGIETDGKKDKTKMAAFARAVRKEEEI